MIEKTASIESVAVMLSASIPKELTGSPQAQNLYTTVTTLVRSLLASGFHLVFGGHPTITPLVHRAASRLSDDKPKISLFQLTRYKDQAPKEINDQKVFEELRWIGDPSKPIAKDLSIMREAMVEAAQVAIFIGGKTAGYTGDIPGIRDEYQRFRQHYPNGPVYFIGMLGGESRRLIELSTGGIKEQNTLSNDARRLVHESGNIDSVASMVTQDILSVSRQRSEIPRDSMS